jgi:hypothetical protein
VTTTNTSAAIYISKLEDVRVVYNQQRRTFGGTQRTSHE